MASRSTSMPKIGQCRHPEACRGRARYHTEFRKRILADPLLIELDIALYRIEVGWREIGNLRMKIGAQLYRFAACPRIVRDSTV